jgi:hypothetical protein
VRLGGEWKWLSIMPALGISARELSCTTREPVEPFSRDW